MQAKDSIRQSINLANMMVDKYLDDLDDDAFFVRPVHGMNHIAWQMGHLITSENGAVEALKPGSCPPLPEGFDAKHKKETAELNDPGQFYTKTQYMALWKAQRAATLAALESLDDAELDGPVPEPMRAFCSTVGEAFNLMGGGHPLMHVGQFVAVRRQLGKPIAM